MTFAAIPGLIGGLGLFLLGMWLLTDGLKLAAGGALRRILGAWTRTHTRGLVSGVLVTALVQSSGAVTVALIGFVNSGLLTLGEAVWVVFGSNVGTSVTAWLVSLIGLRVDVTSAALPLVGVGMLMRLTGPGTRRGAFGTALAGFGVFFVGLERLREVFADLGSAVSVTAIDATGPGGALLGVGAGLVVTVLTQSSSAAVALVLTAAQGGLLTVPAAAAVIIGANLGTTSTAGLAAIGATPPAKRVAAAHVLFNVVTAVAALLVLPLLLSIGDTIRSEARLADSPAVALALFHSIFNVLGVLLMWPLAPRLLPFLERRFRTYEEEESRPRHLDAAVLAVPHVALAALRLEISRVAHIATEMATFALSAQGVRAQELERRHVVVESLHRAIGDAVARVARGWVPDDVARKLPTALAALEYANTVVERALMLGGLRGAGERLADPALEAAVAAYDARVLALLRRADPTAERVEVSDLEQLLARVDEEYGAVKAALLAGGAGGRIDVDAMGDRLQRIQFSRRCCRSAVRCAAQLAQLPRHDRRAAARAAPAAPAGGAEEVGS